MSFEELPSLDRVNKTAEAIRARGIKVEIVQTKEEALARVVAMIPAGVSLTTAASVTLKQIGFEAMLKEGNHPWHNLKAEIVAEKDPAKQSAMRKQATLAEFYLGSVHAIAETGEIITASGSGSQVAPYAFSSRNIIWVAGAQKIVASLEEGLIRLRQYVHPKEDQRMKESGVSAGSIIGKILIVEREATYLRRSVTLILVNEVLGF